MFLHQAQVLWNKNIGADYYKIGLSCPEHYTVAKPGQFIMLGFSGQTDPLLRRPFSIHKLITSESQTKGFELLYKVVGKGTAIMARQRPGERGYLSRNYDFPMDTSIADIMQLPLPAKPFLVPLPEVVFNPYN